MSVERLGSGGSSLRGLAGGGVLLLVLALVGRVPGEESRTALDPPPRPDPAVTLVQDDGRTTDRTLDRLGRQWSATFDDLLAGLPVVPWTRSELAAASPVLSSTGSLAGYVWRDQVNLGAGEEWTLMVEILRLPPWRYADPCRPERWGMAGAQVLSCETGRDGDETLRVRATSAPAGGPTDPSVAGWTYVSDVRDGDEHVQLLLVRRIAGTGKAPLAPDELDRMALHEAWYGR